MHFSTLSVSSQKKQHIANKEFVLYTSLFDWNNKTDGHHDTGHAASALFTLFNALIYLIFLKIINTLKISSRGGGGLGPHGWYGPVEE